MCRVMLTAFVG